MGVKLGVFFLFCVSSIEKRLVGQSGKNGLIIAYCHKKTSYSRPLFLTLHTHFNTQSRLSELSSCPSRTLERVYKCDIVFR